ncbi:hypothetical protein E1A91_D04G181700v1 [Gossypium mustelinum]|uniref:RING-type E3 ubiquitin transferase n=1 Tax=Gossypium mustelinum TaxID=34275 RepID=A0A5D2VFC0_GOSMU|nr:hypothetical protein E1A91_D04G181700v1 [Gossypium mustelinum]TYI88084.1 hypothetical protein E1A91_D04G181700v1 [Gossypium mustelinum]
MGFRFHFRNLGYNDSSIEVLAENCDDHDDGCNDSCASLSCFQDDGSIAHHHSALRTKYLIIIFTVLAFSFFILCLYVYYVRYYRRRPDFRRRRSNETTETRDEFLDEDHGPVVDHHVWYINTVGLQPSIIDSIAVFKYVKGEGLVEGTECSVCLNEFEEGETLRLLPKCSHAFHISCIDTWLRSHTNCPMCRAPIVSNMADKGPSSSSGVNNEVTEGTQVAIILDNEESEGQTGSVTSEMRHRPYEEDERNTEDEDGVLQPVRRSVSLDSMAASQISQALANNGLAEGSNGSNLDNELGKGKESSLRIVPRRGAGNQGLLRLMCNSSIGRRSLQIRPIFMKRSFSCNGKFSLPISNRNRNPPLRSF